MPDSSMDIVEQAFLALGFIEGRKTDPDLMISILQEMEIDDLQRECTQALPFLNEATAQPVVIDEYLDRVKLSLSQSYPMIVEFLELALVNNWLRASDQNWWSLHVGLIIESLTTAMLESNEFTQQIRSHINAKRTSYGINNASVVQTFFKSWQLTQSSFLAAKVVSTDPALAYFIFHRQHLEYPPGKLKEKYLSGQLSFLNYIAQLPIPVEEMSHYHDGVQVNIMEACVTEYLAGFEDNALCAQTLMLELEKHPLIKNAQGHIEPLSQDWIALYESWNAAFMLGDIDDLPLVLPKLFIPALLEASPEKYIETRTFSLWITLNALLIKMAKGAPLEAAGPSSKQAAMTWGSINKAYALSFANTHLQLGGSELVDGFHKRFRWPRLRFLLFVMKCLFSRRKWLR